MPGIGRIYQKNEQHFGDYERESSTGLFFESWSPAYAQRGVTEDK